MVELVRTGFRVSTMVRAPIYLFAALAMGIPLVGTSTYAQDKVLQTFTLGALATFAPVLVLKTRRAANRLVWMMAAVGGACAALALSGHISHAQYDRFAVLDANTIQTARIIGVAIVWISVLTLRKRLPVMIGVLAIAFLIPAALGTGARGPLVAAGTSLVVLLSVQMFDGRGNRGRLGQRARAAFVVAAMGLFIVAGYASAPHYSKERIFTVGKSGEERLTAYRATAREIFDHPLGIGWGRWEEQVGRDVSRGSHYPHNLLLEVFVEAGWIAGAVLCWYLWHIGRIARAIARIDAMGQAAFALYLYYLANSFLSDDIVGARVLLAMSGLVLALAAMQAPRVEHEVPESHRVGLPPT